MTHHEQSIDVLLCVLLVLANDWLVELSGLQMPRFSEITKMNYEEIATCKRRRTRIYTFCT